MEHLKPRPHWATPFSATIVAVMVAENGDYGRRK